VPKAARRHYTAEFKLRVLRAADACTKPGEIGALLRREGLYSSLLTSWRRERERGELDALAPKKRGRRANDPRDAEIERLRREVEKLQDRLGKAELIIDVQKKVAQMLGAPPAKPEGEGKPS
jgi:transposase-like protein